MKNNFFNFPTSERFTENVSFHPSFSEVEKQVQCWLARFNYPSDQSLSQNFYLFYLLAPKKFLDHRNISHLASLLLSIHLMQKTLAQKVAFSPQDLHVKIRWLSGTLAFPFSTHPILGCLVGYNAIDQYELFDEENLFLAFHKQYPDIRLVKECSYQHHCQNKNLKIHYFEIEKKDGTNFSLNQQNCKRHF